MTGLTADSGPQLAEFAATEPTRRTTAKILPYLRRSTLSAAEADVPAS